MWQCYRLGSWFRGYWKTLWVLTLCQKTRTTVSPCSMRTWNGTHLKTIHFQNLSLIFQHDCLGIVPIYETAYPCNVFTENKLHKPYITIHSIHLLCFMAFFPRILFYFLNGNIIAKCYYQKSTWLIIRYGSDFNNLDTVCYY